MPVAIQIEVDTKGAQQKVGRYARAFSERAYLKLVGQRVLAWIDENFRAHGLEQPWKPLSANTLASRRKGGMGAEPLRDTGRMAQAFAMALLPDSVTVGTQDEKAVWHHLGTTGPYEIHPKNKKALAFFTAAAQEVGTRRVLYRSSATGRLIRTRRKDDRTVRRWVLHPGLAARPLLPTKALAEQLAQNVMDAYLQKITRENP